MEIIKETTYKGTRILLGNGKREMIDGMIAFLKAEGFTEISIPVIQYQSHFEGKVGEENNNLMYNFKDRALRDLCLAPEYTAIIQKLSTTTFKMDKDIKLFYVQECFRGEKPQEGRYRQFTQLGVEVINPTALPPKCPSWTDYMLFLALSCLKAEEQIEINTKVKRGLDYYKEGKGFEITAPSLGAQKQICGGGAYEGGIGFAIGIDRLLLIN